MKNSLRKAWKYVLGGALELMMEAEGRAQSSELKVVGKGGTHFWRVHTARVILQQRTQHLHVGTFKPCSVESHQTVSLWLAHIHITFHIGFWLTRLKYSQVEKFNSLMLDFFFRFHFYFVMFWIEPRALFMPGEPPISELHPHPWVFVFSLKHWIF